MTIIKCEECGAEAEVDYTGMVVCTNASCGFSYYDPLMDEGSPDGFLPITQKMLSDNKVDWNSYKNWCFTNDKNVADARVLIFYVQKVVGLDPVGDGN